MHTAFITHPECLRHDTGVGHPEAAFRLHAIDGGRAARVATRPRDSCPLCGSGARSPMSFEYVHAGERYPAGRCRDCDLVFLTTIPTSKGLEALYDAEYFESDYHCGHELESYFAVFRDYFLHPEEGLDYRAVAEKYGITTVNVSNYLMFAKRRYRIHLRRAVMETVSTPEDLAEELDWLFRGVI